NEVDAPAGVTNVNSGGRLAFDGNGPAINAEAPGVAPAEAADLPLDQTFPRLLYELAIRLPALREIQAVCVWLYEPVRHAIRPHLLMADLPPDRRASMALDRKSTRLNSSHVSISYAVFCLKKKK